MTRRSVVGACLALVCVLALAGQPAKAQDEPLIPGLSAEEEEIAIFVLGNTIFTVYHEIGHALISELDLPVLGREEDAVDGYAAVMMLPDAPDPLSDALVISAADGWALLADAMAERGEELAFWDDHGLDEQRYFSAICHITGSDIEGFYDFALESGLPEERIETCERDFQQIRRAWTRLLALHTASAGPSPNGRIRVVYNPASGDHAALQDMVRDTGVAEAAARRVSAAVRFPRDLTLGFESCDGEPDAWWDPDAGKVVICHELLAEFRDLIEADIARAD